MLDLLLYLIIYSFLGWCCECIYCAFGTGKWVNRGFLTGPFCPIYGFGAVAVLLALAPLPHKVSAIFLGGIIITSTLEYVTSFLMEKIFHAKWWDYSKRPFNIRGRVCLLNSTLFGILCLVLFFDLHPAIENLIAPFNTDFKMGFLFAFMIYFVIDLAVSTKSALGINIRLKALEQLRKDMIAKYEELDEKLDYAQLQAKLLAMEIKDDIYESRKDKQLNLGYFERRQLKAFPEMMHQKYQQQLRDIKTKYQV